MRKFKKPSVIMILALTVGAMLITFGFGLLKPETKSAVNAISREETGGPTITAVVKSTVAYTDSMGKIQVGADSLRLNGFDSNTFYAYGEEVSVSANWKPNCLGKHFQFSGIGTDIALNIVPGHTDEGIFKADSSAVAIKVLANDTRLANDNFTFFSEEDYDYQIEVYLIPRIYTLTLQTVFFHDETDADASDYFLANGQPDILDVKWGDKITLNGGNPESANIPLRFVSAEIFDIHNEAFDIIFNNTITFDENLDDFVIFNNVNNYNDGGEIKIRGVYSQLIKVIIESNAPQNNIMIHSASNISGSETFFGANNYYFERNSVLVIFALSSYSTSFTFNKFVVNNSDVPGNSTTYIIDNLDKQYTIQLNFNKKAFLVSMEGLDNLNQLVDLGTSAKLFVDSVTNPINNPKGITIDALSELRFNYIHILPNYKLEGLYFMKGGILMPIEKANGEMITLAELNQMTFDVDESFIENNTAENKILFVARFTKLYAVNITSSIPNAGNSKMYFYNETTGKYEIAETKYFPEGTQIKIEVTENKYHSFSEASGIVFEENNLSAECTVTRGDDININLVFKAQEFMIEETKDYLFSHSKISVGTQLTITYSGTSNGVIKSWTINGKPLDHFSDKTRIQKNGKVLTITVNEAFIDKFFNPESPNLQPDGSFALAFIVKASTAMGLGTIIAIATPSVAIPVALTILLIFILVNNKRKKVIRANLTEDLRRETTLNTGGFISDLREGKTTGEVTDADVKRVLKEQKEEKKSANKEKRIIANEAEKAPAKKAAGTPAAEQTPPVPESIASAAAKPAKVLNAKQLIKLFDGSTLAQDMSFIKDGAIIAKLQKDLSIHDLSGNVIAAARMSDGKLIDKDGNEVGIITGNGIVKKP